MYTPKTTTSERTVNTDTNTNEDFYHDDDDDDDDDDGTHSICGSETF